MKKIKGIALFAVVLLVLAGTAIVYGQTTTQTCTACKGSGKLIIQDPCANCKGTGTYVFMGVKTICTYCFGNGIVSFACPTCNGSGKETVSTAPAPASPGFVPPPQNNSPAQGGGGNIGNRITCSSCGGTGICPTCRGNYAPNCTYCNGRGKTTYGYGSNAKYETCAPCKGSGKNYCAICYDVWHNPGKCGDCKGRGYIQ